MRKAKVSEELRPEYKREDLGVRVRGKYSEEYRKGTNLVLLRPDVARVFSTDESVNDALCSLIGLAEKSTGRTRRSTGDDRLISLDKDWNRHRKMNGLDAYGNKTSHSTAIKPTEL